MAKKKKPEEINDNFNIYEDADFYFIAGYTSNGVPFGITYNQAVKDNLIDDDRKDGHDDDELPF